jgi:ribosomal protein S16
LQQQKKRYASYYWTQVLLTRDQLENNTKRVLLDIERAKYWIATGAQPTKTG